MSRKPLSKLQVTALAIEAKKAWLALAPETRAKADLAAVLATNDPTLSAAKIFEHWRRQEQEQACGKASMGGMDNADFDRVMARWKSIQSHGTGPLAKEAYVMDTQAEARRLRHVIRAACTAAKLPEEYAQTICRDKGHGLSLDEADDGVLSQVLSTLNNRVRHSAQRAPGAKPRKSHDWERERTVRDGISGVALAAHRTESVQPATTAPTTVEQEEENLANLPF